MNRILWIAGMAMLCVFSSAQSLERSVTGSAGSHATAGGYQISQTVGEPLVTTLVRPGYMMTQGFHQPGGLAPVVVDDAYAVAEGGVLDRFSNGVTVNDYDPDGDPLQISIEQYPEHGSLEWNLDGGFKYTHNHSETTSDHFLYRVWDGQRNSVLGRASIEITPVNDAPVAVADTYSVRQGQTLTILPDVGVLANDSDADGDVLNAVLVDNVDHGGLNLNPGGSFSYVHNGNDALTDSFSYYANDGTANSAVVTVTLAITPNQAPTGVADSYTINEGETLTIAAPGVLANDSDPEGDPLEALPAGGVSHGSLTLNPNGGFTYVHDGGEDAQDTFTYYPYDGNKQGAATQVTIYFNAVNDVPVASADAYSLRQGQTLTILPDVGVLANDSDADGDVLNAVLVDNVDHGGLNLNPGGSFSYVHNGNDALTDSFSYYANDGTANSNVVTVTLAITPNQAPTGVADSYTINEGETLTIAAAGVLANDSDPEGDPLEALPAGGVSHGSLTLNPNGGFTYVHDGGKDAQDTFTYYPYDGNKQGAATQVTININSVNDAPVAVADAYSLRQGQTLTILPDVGVLANDNDVDGDALNAVLVDNVDHGGLNLNPGGSFSYIHNGNDALTDSFSYYANDGTANSNVVTVTFTITPNQAPIGVADSYTINEGETLTIAAPGVLANDSDPEGDPLEALPAGDVSHGSLTLNPNGGFTYVHDGGEDAQDTFTYYPYDGNKQGAATQVTIYFNAVNDAPVAVADAYSLRQGQTLTILPDVGVLANDNDVDGDALNAVLVDNVDHGGLNLNPGGSFSYIHNGNDALTDSFSYYANDGTANSTVVTVTLTITPNQAPTGVADSYTINEGETLTIAAAGVLANDSDPEGDPLEAQPGGDVSHGSLTLNQDGGFTYTHDGGEDAQDTFTYYPYDGNKQGAATQVTININAVNEAPVAVADSYTVSEGDTLTIAAADGVLANDTDADGDSLQAMMGGNVAHGSLTLNSDGSFTYAHDSSESTSDTFSYTVHDGTAQGNTVIVTLNITLNESPVVTADAYTLDEGETLTVSAAQGVLANDSDAENDTMTVSLAGNVAHGSLTLNPDGSFTYAHNGGEDAGDTFSYTVSDGTDTTAPTLVTLTINPVNDAPVAVAESYTVAEGDTLTIAAADGVLANDTDVEGDSLQAILSGNVAHGSLTLNADGSFTYAHNSSESTSDTFSYFVHDGTAQGNTVIVTIHIIPNASPVVTADAYTLDEGETLTVAAAQGVLANDSDAENDTMTVSLAGNVAHGSLTLNPDGSFTYAHNGGEDADDTFSYTVSDGTDTTAPTLVTLTINPVNDAPVAVAESYTVDEGQTLTMNAADGVLANDTDADGDELQAGLAGNVAHGTLTLNPDGSFTYVHDSSESTSDTFGYTVSDGTAQGNTVIVTLNITPNASPVVNADAYTLDEGETLTVAAAQGVLANDSDAESDPMTVSLAGNVAHGSLTLNPDGSFTYAHNGGEDADDTFSYTVSDGSDTTAPTLVTLTINPVNDAPVAVAESYTVDEGQTLTMNAAGGVLANDTDAEGDSLLAIVAGNVAHGSLTLNPDGSFTYVHDSSESTSDTFGYTVSDGTAQGNTVIVTLNITPNASPVVNADAYTLDEGETLTVAAAQGVLANDSDAESDPMTVSLAGNVAHGSLTLNPDGSFTYAHNGGEDVGDTFSYTVSDGTDTTAPTLVTLTINPVNDAPVAVAESYTVDEGQTLTIDAAAGVLANDTDPDGDTLQAGLAGNVAHGTLTLNPDGSFTYVHDSSESTSDTFGYTVSDGTAQGNTVIVTLNITPNASPVVNADAYTLDEGETLTVAAAQGVLANDTDAENDTMTVSLAGNVAHGSLTLNPDGSFTYAHNGGEDAGDTFSYTVSDGSDTTAPTLVTLTINPVNDAPVAVAESYTVDEGQTLTIDAAAGVLANDTDGEGDTLQATLATNVAHGTLTLNADGSFSYVHDSSEFHTDSFSYTVVDGTASGNTVTVTLNVTLNASPIINGDAYTLDEGDTLTVDAAQGLFANDSDPEGDTLEAILGANVAHGTLMLNPDGSFTYTHDGEEDTSDSFSYTLSDGSDTVGPVNVVLTITPVNDAPTDLNLSATAFDENTGAGISIGALTTVDDDATGHTYTLVTGEGDADNDKFGISGDQLVTAAFFNYEEKADYTIRIRTTDAGSEHFERSFTITINDINDPPVAEPDTYTLDEGGTLTIDAPGILANDSDEDGDSFTIVNPGTTSYGTLTLNADGSFTYAHDGGEAPTDSFSYTLNDGTEDSGVRTVTFTINAVNDAPESLILSGAAVDEMQPAGTEVGGFTTVDVDDSSHTYTLVSGAGDTDNGNFIISGDQLQTATKLDYAAQASHSIRVRTEDSGGESLEQVFTITVNDTNQAPVGVDDSYTLDHGEILTMTAPGVLVNDSDVDDDVITPILDTTTVNGSLDLNADGSFTYVHDGSDTATDSFTYIPWDGNLAGEAVTVTLTIKKIVIPSAEMTLILELETPQSFLPPDDQTGTWSLDTNLGEQSYDLTVDSEGIATFVALEYGLYALNFTGDLDSFDRIVINAEEPVIPDDPFYYDTVLYLDFEDEDGSTEFYDLSPAVQEVQAHVNAVIKTDNAYAGSGSLFLDGESWLQIPVNESLVFGSDAVTIDFWIYSQSVDYREDFISFDVAGGSDYSSILYYPNHSQISLYERNGGTTLGNVDIRNGWHHIAYVRDGVNTRFYLDGVERYNAPSTSTELLGRSDFFIGGWRPSPDYHPHPTHGYIDEFRVTRAVRYTADFDPNTEP